MYQRQIPRYPANLHCTRSLRHPSNPCNFLSAVKLTTGNLPNFERTAELNKRKSILGNPPSDARRSLRLFGRVLVVFAISGLATQAGCQQSPQKLEAELPDAPQAQSSLQAPTAPAAPTDPDKSAPASIRGVIVDREGAVYQGVHITLTTTADALPKSANSDVNGRFQFTGVPAGPYQITIDSNGFATKRITGLVHPGEVYDAPPITLLFSTATSEVQVTASHFEIAQEELKQEEQQRVFGAIPNFYVVYAPNAPSLTTRQKFHLAWRSSIDPVSILAAGGAAGIQQAEGDFKGYGQGSKGYAKRFGAAYADDFIGNMMGGAVFPSLFKQDPRYFYKGTGTRKARALYAIANAVVCKGDNGHWQFDYSGILGSLAAAGISNIYYPAADRNGAGLTFRNTATGIGFSAIGNLFQEFLVKRLTPKVPDYSTDKP